MNTNTHSPANVLQLRVIGEAGDFDAAIAFYRDTLGLQEQAAFEGDGDARVSILDADRATVIGGPRETPWRSLNSRLDAPAGLQLTIFQELEDAAHRTQRPGFGTSTDR